MPTLLTLLSSLQDPLPLLDDPMCELPPIIDDFDPNSLQPILTPPQPMDFFDSEYPQSPQWQQQGRQQRPRRQQRQQRHEELPREQRRRQQQSRETSVVASRQTPPSSTAAPAHTTTATTTTTTVDRSSRSRSLTLDVNPGGDAASGMSVVERMESLEHEYKRVKRELLRDEGGGGPDADSDDGDPELCRGGEEELEKEDVWDPPFGPDLPRRCPRDECPSALRRQRSTDKLLSIFGSDDGGPHLNEEEDGGGGGRFMFLAAASSPCGGGGDGKALGGDCAHPNNAPSATAPSRRRNTKSKADIDPDSDLDAVARPLHDLADQLVELRLSLQRAEVGGGCPPQRTVYTIPEEEGEGGDAGGGGVRNEGKERFGCRRGEDGRDSGTADPEKLLLCQKKTFLN